MRRRRELVPVLALAAVAALLPLAAGAHDERPAHFPPGTGHVPEYRAGGPTTLTVCGEDRADFATRVASFPDALRRRNQALFEECQGGGYRELQKAVDAVRQPGVRILVLPGVYREPSSLAPPAAECASLKAPRSRYGYQILTYEQQRQCPHLQNLVGIFGVNGLQVEGTGARPTDVVFDGDFRKLNVIRADRSDGVYFRNLTVQKATFNALYVMETDGFVIDQVLGRWDEEYGFLTFASDHGLYTDCEAYGNGDSGLYPGGTSDINGKRGDSVTRYAIEIRRCHSHHNLLGYSGTGGDSVWLHDSELDANSAGASMDSAFPNHPGLPQNHALFEDNRIHGNNQDYFRFVRDGTCAKPYRLRGVEEGVVCPAVGVPVGTGVILAGGNYDLFRRNQVWDNRRYGFLQLWVPGFVRNDLGLAAQFETSHHNRYLSNRLGAAPDGSRQPNGVDFWWDGQGRGNCWQGGASSDPLRLPGCSEPGPARLVAPPATVVDGLICTSYSRADAYIPAFCAWYQTPPEPGAPQLDPGTSGFLLAGLQALVLVPLALVWWRRRPDLRAGPAGAAGPLVVLVAAAGPGGPALAALGLVLLGAWWLELGYGLLGSGRRGLAWATLVLGALAVLEAADLAFDLPLLPLGPAWPRAILTFLWVPWAALALVRRQGRILEPVEKTLARI